MNEISKELIEKAKNIKTVEELITFAKENSIEITEEEAKFFINQNNLVKGELSDDQLDNVAGGKYSDGVDLGLDGKKKYLIVTAGYGTNCDLFSAGSVGVGHNCGHCYYRESRGITMYCSKKWKD